MNPSTKELGFSGRGQEADGSARGLSAQQIALRSDKLGASDAPAVLGLDPYRSASDVWLEKTGRCDPFAGNDATRRGQYQEPGLCMFAEDRTGVQFFPSTTFVHESGLLLATPDRLSKDMKEGVEAKSTALTEGWGEPGTDQIPEKVLVQVAQQFACVPTLQVIWVPVELLGFKSIDWELYHVERNGPSVQDMIAWVVENGMKFMREYVRANRKPDDYRPSLEVLRRVRRVPNKIVPVDYALVSRCLAAREAVKRANEYKEKADSYLLASIGDAEAATWDGGKLSFMETHRKAYEVKETTYRSLRITPDGKKKLPLAPEDQPAMLGATEMEAAIEGASK